MRLDYEEAMDLKQEGEKNVQKRKAKQVSPFPSLRSCKIQSVPLSCYWFAMLVCSPVLCLAAVKKTVKISEQ